MADDNQPDVASLERERLAADRRYNDALTAADRAIVRSGSRPAAIGTPATDPPPVPPGWRGRWLRAVHAWLAPLFAEQHAFNERIAAELNAGTARQHDATLALEEFQTALIIFLQQITAFVDTKVRVAEATTTARFADDERTLAAVPDLRAQVETLQRIVQSLKRPSSNAGAESQPRSTSPAPETGAADVTYVAFEDRFRGSDEEIREKQSAYLPVFAGASDVLDIGCGRGEFLALLKEKDITARGVDVNAEMIAVARDRGLDATKVDALTYVAGLADASLGGLMCAQVIEHLEPAYLIGLLETLSHKLRPGAPAIIETINPACWLAFFSSYIRDFTHVRPIHPETLEYLLHASGFGRVSVRYSAPVPGHMKMAAIDLPPALSSSSDPASQALVAAAHVVNANSTILNNLMFTYLDYAAIAFRS